jgi:hypothetical protein
MQNSPLTNIKRRAFLKPVIALLRPVYQVALSAILWTWSHRGFLSKDGCAATAGSTPCMVRSKPVLDPTFEWTTP